ncbi:Z-ring formation inhibitor MciZ [Fredinandcohnia salidurans]|uniref:Z-ring formation inhibitor MciZ n=1 Tax=Fredinandcohnia salidurans TaxID=2595041 RepID=A0ABW4MGU6_9BACI
MKIVIGENRVALVGKAWEIREKLKEYSRSYRTVQEWIDQGKGKQEKK